MPVQRTSTPVSNATRTGPFSRLQSAPYPLNRPQSGTRSTPGTARPRTTRPRTATSTTGNDTNVIAAVTESIDLMNLTDILDRGSAVCVGLCFLSLDTGECILSQVLCNCVRRLTQICDSQTYGKTIHKLAVFDPLEVRNALSLYPDVRLCCLRQISLLKSRNCVKLSRRIYRVHQSFLAQESSSERTWGWNISIK